MMQRGNGEGSCSACERFVCISQGKKTTGLAEELDWFLLSPLLSSSLQRAALFPGAVGAVGGLGHSPRAAFSCYCPSIFRSLSGPVGLAVTYWCDGEGGRGGTPAKSQHRWLLRSGHACLELLRGSTEKEMMLLLLKCLTRSFSWWWSCDDLRSLQCCRVPGILAFEGCRRLQGVCVPTGALDGDAAAQPS